MGYSEENYGHMQADSVRVANLYRKVVEYQRSKTQVSYMLKVCLPLYARVCILKKSRTYMY
jgi:hypothetical protein